MDLLEPTKRIIRPMGYPQISARLCDHTLSSFACFDLMAIEKKYQKTLSERKKTLAILQKFRTQKYPKTWKDPELQTVPPELIELMLKVAEAEWRNLSERMQTKWAWSLPWWDLGSSLRSCSSVKAAIAALWPDPVDTIPAIANISRRTSNAKDELEKSRDAENLDCSGCDGYYIDDTVDAMSKNPQAMGVEWEEIVLKPVEKGKSKLKLKSITYGHRKRRTEVFGKDIETVTVIHSRLAYKDFITSPGLPFQTTTFR